MQGTYNSVLAPIEKEFPVVEMHVDFLKSEPSLQLIRLSRSNGVHDMPEKNDFNRIDIMFPFICTFIEKATAYFEDAKVTKVNKIYSELVLEFCSRSSKTNTDLKRECCRGKGRGDE